MAGQPATLLKLRRPTDKQPPSITEKEKAKFLLEHNLSILDTQLSHV
jgi:hypothetical protein